MNRLRFGPRSPNDGDGWVTCRCGHRHWGRYGAVGLLLARDGDVLLQHRAAWSHQGGTWAVPGGARASCEDALTAALREAHEEARVPPDVVRPLASYVEDHHSWSYTTIVATADRRFDPSAGDAESLELAWVACDAVAERPLHPAFARAWASLRSLLSRRLVLVVDAANVVGSVPDGWWRDRVGATTRLRDRLRHLASAGLPEEVLRAGAEDDREPGRHWWPEIILVTEGQARSVEPSEGIRVIAAEREGDDTIVDAVADRRGVRPSDRVFAVTADRELRRRVIDQGGQILSPAALLGLLP